MKKEVLPCLQIKLAAKILFLILKKSESLLNKKKDFEPMPYSLIKCNYTNSFGTAVTKYSNTSMLDDDKVLFSWPSIKYNQASQI